MNLTSIEWTTFSSNPLRYRDADGKVVWGCVHASPGCLHCYSEAQAHRYQKGGPFNVQTMSKLTPFLDEKELHHMLTAKTIKGVQVAGSRCFVGDMTDIFGDWVPDELLDRLFAVFALRRDVTWQVLTKRAQRMHDYMVSRSKSADYWKSSARSLGYTLEFDGLSLVPFPLPNAWLGVSCEDQPRLDERALWLQRTPAAVRFFSGEPLLSHLNFRGYLNPGWVCPACSEYQSVEHEACRKCGTTNQFNGSLHGIDWVIVGGESGPNARPMHPDWARSLRNQCVDAGVPFFFKQVGGRTPKSGGRLLDGREWNEFPEVQRADR